jgi:hypothetical protein
MWIERHVAQRLEAQEIVLRQRLLRGEPRPVAEAPRPGDRGRRHADLEEVPTRDHACSFACSYSYR